METKNSQAKTRRAFQTTDARIGRHAAANGYRNVRALLIAARVSESSYSRWRAGKSYPNLRSLDRIFAQGPAKRNGRRTA